MSQNYSPFSDRHGNPIPFEKIRFSHIVQLHDKDVEEGYQVEYKSRWDDNFIKTHLCKTIASFANSEGGWLFIGIEDGSAKYQGIKKQRADFSQIISQKLREVSPTPKYNCRFIKSTDDKNEGVLIIYVYEGINPPYICDGTVYLRSGSSKIPIKSGRTEIDNLVRKREKYTVQREKFCTNPFVDSDTEYPFCSIYMHNPYGMDDINTLEETLQQIKSKLREVGYGNYWTYSSDSVLCYISNVIAPNTTSSILEFFANGNVKIFTPLFLVQPHIHEAHSRLIHSFDKNIDISKMLVLDGCISFLSMFNNLNNTIRFLKINEWHINDYTTTFEYKNIRNSILYFPPTTTQSGTETIGEQIKNGELAMCLKHSITTRYQYFFDDISNNEEDILRTSFELIKTGFALPFGLDSRTLLKQLSTSSTMYPEGTYCSKFFSSTPLHK